MSPTAIIHRSPDVDAWFDAYDHPLKEVMQRVREIILGADPRIRESVKWSTPTFGYHGNLGSFQPRAKRFVSVLLQEGTSIPGTHRLLVGDGPHVRTMHFADIAAVEAARPGIEAIVRAWCDSRE